jgi:cell wall-associated NlpC family hydrolase
VKKNVLIRHITKTISIICLLALPVIGFSQTKKIDKLEQLFDQGHYKKVIKKADALLNRPEYDHFAQPILFKTLAVYNYSKDPNAKRKYRKKGLELSIEYFKEFKQKDRSGVVHAQYVQEIEQLKQVWYAHVADLHHENDQKKAQAFYAELDGFFNHHKTYEEIVKHEADTPIVDHPLNIDDQPIVMNGMRDSMVVFAQQYIGVPYKWAGNDPSGFDCSGYTKFVLNQYGYKLPRIAGDQYEVSKDIKHHKAQKGDLVFFGTKKGSGYNITHVGIIVSNPGEDLTMIHASSSRGIMISNIEKSNYWRPKLLFTGNIVDELSKN